MRTLVTETLDFVAMGTTGRITVEAESDDATHALLRGARDLVEVAEHRWSRFLPDSDVSALNDHPGERIAVDPATLDLLADALHAWSFTDGRFSPFLQKTMHAIGYANSRTFAGRNVHCGSSATGVIPAASRIGPDEHPPITIDRAGAWVIVSPGFGIDLGGIAKGHTADLVLADLRRRGARSAIVDLGGDTAMATDDPGQPWTVDVQDPQDPDRIVASAAFICGGVATSSTLRRRWTGPDGVEHHHLVDPATGASAAGPTVAVTVAADSCAHAEVLTKDLLLLPVEVALDRVSSWGLDAVLSVIDGFRLRHHLIGTWSQP